MNEFHSKPRIPWLRALTRIGPMILVLALLGVAGTLRLAEGVLPALVFIVLGVALIGYFAGRALIERRALHVKISSDWIRIRRGSRVLSAPLHYVVIERSALFDNNYSVAHPRKKLRFRFSLDQFPEPQRAPLALLLSAHSRPSSGVLAALTGTGPTAD